MYEGQYIDQPAKSVNQLGGIHAPGMLNRNVPPQPVSSVGEKLDTTDKLTYEIEATARQVADALSGSNPCPESTDKACVPQSVIERQQAHIWRLQAILNDLQRAAQALGI